MFGFSQTKMTKAVRDLIRYCTYIPLPNAEDIIMLNLVRQKVEFVTSIFFSQDQIKIPGVGINEPIFFNQR